MSAPAKAPPAENADQKVERLLRTWEDEIAYFSNSRKIQSHPVLQQIIDIGPDALPALFRELEQHPSGHLARTLTEITGEQPIPPEIFGKGREIAAVWLAWAKAHGYL